MHGFRRMNGVNWLIKPRIIVDASKGKPYRYKSNCSFPAHWNAVREILLLRK